MKYIHIVEYFFIHKILATRKAGKIRKVIKRSTRKAGKAGKNKSIKKKI